MRRLGVACGHHVDSGWLFRASSARPALLAEDQPVKLAFVIKFIILVLIKSNIELPFLSLVDEFVSSFYNTFCMTA